MNQASYEKCEGPIEFEVYPFSVFIGSSATGNHFDTRYTLRTIVFPTEKLAIDAAAKLNAREATVATLTAEAAQLRSDWAEDDTAIKALFAPFGIASDHPPLEGDSGRFKSCVEVAEEAAKMLARKQSALDCANSRVQILERDLDVERKAHNCMSELQMRVIKSTTAEAAEQSEEAMKCKLHTLLNGGHGETCGCSYDRPNDVCMHHSPALVAATNETAELRAEVGRLEKIVEHVQYLTTATDTPTSLMCRIRSSCEEALAPTASVRECDE